MERLWCHSCGAGLQPRVSHMVRHTLYPLSYLLAPILFLFPLLSLSPPSSFPSFHLFWLLASHLFCSVSPLLLSNWLPLARSWFLLLPALAQSWFWVVMSPLTSGGGWWYHHPSSLSYPLDHAGWLLSTQSVLGRGPENGLYWLGCLSSCELDGSLRGKKVWGWNEDHIWPGDWSCGWAVQTDRFLDMKQAIARGDCAVRPASMWVPVPIRNGSCLKNFFFLW